MPDIFISYSHKDSEFVRDLIQPLEAEGFSVWWDHSIPPGKTWDDVIARGIREAKACLVVWSANSVASDWVKEEATLAKEAGKFLPILVGVDQPPMGFRRVQAADFRRWNGNRQDPQWRLLMAEIAQLVHGGFALPAPPKPPTPLTPSTPLEAAVAWARTHRPVTALIALGLVAFALVVASPWRHAGVTTPPIATAPGGVDPAVVGTFTLDTVVVDVDTHYVDTINADGSYTLTGVQEEDGHNRADANGNYANVGLKTGRVHTGSVRILDNTHFQAGTTVYQLAEPLLPPGQPNPSLLGTWTANGLVAGQAWNWTWISKTPGTYHFEGHMSDRGHASFANGLWTATSSVTGQTGGGNYGIVDANHILINGVVWARQ
jgi:hypothetical protein